MALTNAERQAKYYWKRKQMIEAGLIKREPLEERRRKDRERKARYKERARRELNPPDEHESAAKKNLKLKALATKKKRVELKEREDWLDAKKRLTRKRQTHLREQEKLAPSCFIKIENENDFSMEADFRETMDTFCRCCFKKMSDSDIQHPLDDHTMQAMSEMTSITPQPSTHAQSFCDDCFYNIQAYYQFKLLTIARQQRFNELMTSESSDLNFELTQIFQIGSFAFIDPTIKEEKENDRKPLVVNDQTTRSIIREDVCTDNQKRTKPKETRQKKKYACRKCSYSTFVRKTMLNHKKKFHQKIQPKCPLCDFVSTHTIYIKRHMKSCHTEKKSDTCQQCNKTFSTPNYLESHMARKHSKIKNFSCQDCDKKFTIEGDLRQHRINNHSELKEICEICGKLCRSATLLRVHLLTHEEGKFQCDSCGNKYKTKTRVKLHYELVHLNIRKYSCEYCGKRFAWRRVLNVHRLQHQNIKYHCFVPGCKSALTRKDVLIYHMKHNHSLSPTEQADYMEKLNAYCKTLNKMFE